MKKGQKISILTVVLLAAGMGLLLFCDDKPLQLQSVQLEETVVVVNTDVQPQEITPKTASDGLVRIKDVDKEGELIQRGVLTIQQVENRKLLRGVMEDAGFCSISGEW